ncbi:hypothetical protein N7E02_21825 [Aliirhizobium terrae]|uniref:hypothetical protein n=1 Tax=Terrirhizobium terrae TaxID=2926709 RepID=UPI00257664D2|nr:hypothetical protein [Rhizobium sp. CC-CFT758]WJH39438.1 hypothetical protein N7E02_21825 [Rhizobium sp. CC-CFT758]
MLLEGIFGGGKQSTAPSQQPSSSQSSGTTPTSGEADNNDPASADNSQADPIYDEEPGNTNDGTYTDVPPASSEETVPVTEETSAATPDTEEAENEAGTQPQPTDQPDAPVASSPSEPVPEAAEPAPSAGTPSPPEPSQPEADEPVASQPVAGQPAASAPEDTVSAPVPTSPAPSSVTTTPSPVATSPVVDEAVAPVEEEAEEPKDFLTPFLADLEEIRQRQASNTSDARAESRNRAVAAIQEQLASRLLDSLSSETAPTTARSASVLDDSAETAERPMSLVDRWYREA